MTDVALSYRLLRFHQLRLFQPCASPSSTVMQAVTLLGIDNVRSWTTMMVLAQIGGKPRELFVTALVRARFCQLAAEAHGGPSSEMFALGLFSVIDALTDRPMATVVQSLPFPAAMRDALVETEAARDVCSTPSRPWRPEPSAAPSAPGAQRPRALPRGRRVEQRDRAVPRGQQAPRGRRVAPGRRRAAPRPSAPGRIAEGLLRRAADRAPRRVRAN